MKKDEITVIHSSEKLRFEVHLEDHIAELVYRLRDDKIYLMHTGVPEALSNRGIATALAETALRYAVKSGLKLVVYCPFVKAYMEKHPNWREEIL